MTWPGGMYTVTTACTIQYYDHKHDYIGSFEYWAKKLQCDLNCAASTFGCFGYKILCTVLHFWQFNHILLLIHDTLLHLPCVSLIQSVSLPLGRVAGSTGLEILRSCSSVYSSGFLGIFSNEFTMKIDQILKKIAVKWNVGVTKANKIQIWRLLQEVNKSTWGKLCSRVHWVLTVLSESGSTDAK